MINKILNADQMHCADAYSINKLGITSSDLMERAGSAFTKSIVPFVHGKSNVIVFCGNGNNGGDGLVVARKLMEAGISVTTFFVELSLKTKPDCLFNLNRLKNHIILRSEQDFPKLDASVVVIDALLGSGITRPTEGLLARLIKHINVSASKVLSIDIPSGLSFDQLPEEGEIIHANFVGTFQVPKLTFFLKETAPYIKTWEVLNIGLDEEFIEAQDSLYAVVQQGLIDALLRPRKRFSHKGTFGHCLLIGGSKGMMGAPVLAAKSALKSGAGLVSMYVPEIGYQIAQIALPEAMCHTDTGFENMLTLDVNLSAYSAIGIGPGMGRSESVKNVLMQLFENSSVPLVIDADAINALAKSPKLLTKLPPGSVLTPHPKEFERLVGESYDSLERLSLMNAFCKKHQCFIVLKDAITAVGCPSGEVWFNTTGNPGMSTGGAGDVLTGMITSLIGQGYEIKTAIILGVFFHGKAGDQAALHLGENQVIASDIIAHIRIGKQY